MTDDEKIKGVSAEPINKLIDPWVRTLASRFGVHHTMLIRNALFNIAKEIVRSTQHDLEQATARAIKQVMNLKVDPEYFEHRQKRTAEKRAKKIKAKPREVVVIHKESESVN